MGFIYIGFGAVIPFLLFVGYKLWREWKISRKLDFQNIPRFKHPPLIGDLLNGMNAFGAAPGIPKSIYVADFITGAKKIFKNEDMLWFRMGPFNYLLLQSPQAVEVMLNHTKEVNKSEDYDFLRPAVGDGLVTSPYQIWKRRRRMVAQAFHPRILDEYQQVMSECAGEMVKRLEKETGKPIDLGTFISACTFQIIATTAIGIGPELLKDRFEELLQILHKAKNLVFKRIISPWMWPDLLFHFLPEGREFRGMLKILNTIFDEEYPKKKQEMLDDDDLAMEFQGNSASPKKRHTFTEILLKHYKFDSEEPLSDQDIKDEAVTFSIAGFDTSATCLGFTFYLIGLYPDVQRKVQTELDEIFGDDLNRPINPEDLKKMEYLTRVIKESLRLFPPIPLIGRLLQEDLPIRGVTLPKGLRIWIFTSVLHMDPEIFPDPDIFDPDRFLSNDRHPFSFIPFSAGPRNCIGQAFAMMEIKTVLANVLRKYDVTSLDPRDKVLLCPELISQPLKPIRMKLKFRS